MRDLSRGKPNPCRKVRAGVGFTEPQPPPAVQVGVDPARHFCPPLGNPVTDKNHKR